MRFPIRGTSANTEAYYENLRGKQALMALCVSELEQARGVCIAAICAQNGRETYPGM